jgi:hypothetical protein
MPLAAKDRRGGTWVILANLVGRSFSIAPRFNANRVEGCHIRAHGCMADLKVYFGKCAKLTTPEAVYPVLFLVLETGNTFSG